MMRHNRAEKRNVLRRLIGIGGLVFLFQSGVSAAPLVLSLNLDYGAVRSILVRRLFSSPRTGAFILGGARSCNSIEMWDPEIGCEGRWLRVRGRIRVKMGVPLGGTCRGIDFWEGTIELLERVYFAPDSWVLRFETVDSRIYNARGERTALGGTMWGLIKTYVHPYLNEMALDLAPTVRSLQDVLPPLLNARVRPRILGWLRSARPEEVRIGPEAVRIGIRIDMDLPPSRPRKEEEPPLGPEERERVARLWEAWDAFLVYQIRTVGQRFLIPEEREILLDVLLESRYRFLEALEESSGGEDAVRRQFLEAWNRLAPIFRRHWADADTENPYAFLAFFAASDALATLDKVGPELNIEISRSGLRRLARLLSRDGGVPSLFYGYGLDPALRESLGMQAVPDAGMGDPAEEPEGEESRRWLPGLVRNVWAAALRDPETDIKAMRRWLLSGTNVEDYVKRVRKMLDGRAVKTLEGGGLAEAYRPLFRRVVAATAWQESCFRQFVVRGKKIWYLRSYNNTSVGIMQVNERVWRGIFDRRKLRWNIHYNAMAGCRILLRYLRRYVLGGTGSSKDPEYLAQAAYAIYNGGPAERKRFPLRYEKGELYLSDRLFREKYRFVKEKKWEQVMECLQGT